jgi:hypothetical protein
MSHERLDRPLPRPVLARRLAAQIGRSFSEVIGLVYRLDSDADAVLRHFHNQDVAARCRRRRDEAPAPEPIFIMKSESVAACAPIAAPISYPPAPDNSALLAELISRGVLSPAALATGRMVYVSPGLAERLGGA